MGIVKDIVGGITGSSAEAAKDAAAAQVRGINAAIGTQKEARDVAREDIQPFIDTGTTDLQTLADLITNPDRQRQFIEENPFFNALSERARTDLFKNQAARGKLASGETAEALQKSLVLLGADLLSQNVGQRFNLANFGFGATQQKVGVDTGAAANIGNLQVGRGQAQAAGIVGARNAEVGALNDAIKLATFGISGGFSPGGSPTVSI